MPITIICDDLDDNQLLPPEQICTFIINPSSLVCSLTNKKLVDPVVASDGYTYEKEEIYAWFATQKNKSYAQSPKCQHILLIDKHKKLMTIPNLLIKNLLSLDQNATIDVSQAGLIDNITLASTITIAIIAGDGITYDLSSEAKWLEHSGGLTHSSSRAPVTMIFKNLLVQDLLDNFYLQHASFYKITDLQARLVLYLCQHNNLQAAKDIIKNTPELAGKTLRTHGTQLIHLFASIDNVEMVNFLVTEMNIQLHTTDAVGNNILLYCFKNHSIRTLQYCYQNFLPLNMKNTSSNTDLLYAAMLFDNQAIVTSVFSLGYLIHDDKEYAHILVDAASRASFDLITMLIDNLIMQEKLHIVQNILFIAKLADNSRISAAKFEQLFANLCTQQLKQEILTIPACNPYIFGATSANKAYLIGFHSYWQKTCLPAIINNSTRTQIAPGIFTEFNALDKAGLGTNVELIELLLSLDANPAINDNPFFPFAERCAALLEFDNFNWQLIKTEHMLTCLSRYTLVNLTSEVLFNILAKIDVIAMHNHIIANSHAYLIIQLRTLNNVFFSALEQIINTKTELRAIFYPNLSISAKNILHSIINTTNLSEQLIAGMHYLAQKYPTLVWQADEQHHKTPIDYALIKLPSIEQITSFLELVPNFNYTSINIDNFAANPHLSPANKVELQQWLDNKSLQHSFQRLRA